MSPTGREVQRAHSGHTHWRREGEALLRELTFRDFEEALRFVQHVADAAVDYGRRPDMCITEFNHVRLSVWNLRHAGFTEAEMRLVAKVDAILSEHHPDATPQEWAWTR